jgi:hypothetical protein
LAQEASRLMSDPAWVSEAEEIVELLEELS